VETSFNKKKLLIDHLYATIWKTNMIIIYLRKLYKKFTIKKIKKINILFSFNINVIGIF